MISDERVIELAGKAASRYKRRVWWANHEDMKHAGVEAIMSAIPGYDPDYGVEIGAYSWRVAIYAVRRYVLKASAPVSAKHRLDVLKGLYRAEISAYEKDEKPDPEETVHRVLLARTVRTRVESILGETGAAFAIGILGGDFQPKDVIDDHGLKPAEVYHAIRMTKARLQSDKLLYELWRDE